VEPCDKYPHSDLTGTIIRAAIRVHSRLGPGLLESAYQKCLAHEIVRSGLTVERERPMRLIYDGEDVGMALRADLVVQDSVIVEVKAQRRLENYHRSQLLTYLRASGLKVGLLLNFGGTRLRDGILRVVA